MLTRVGSREGEAAGVGVALGDDTVVIIEGFVDGDEHLDVGVDGVGVGLGIGDFGFEVSCFCIRIGLFKA